MNPGYYLYWGNLGDARRWIPGGEAGAKEAYRRAIELTEERLKTAADDAEVTATLAVYLSKSGNAARALAVLAGLKQVTKRTPGSFFKAGIAYEIAGAREQAISALAAAIKGGYSITEIKTEPELTALRGDRRYHALLLQQR